MFGSLSTKIAHSTITPALGNQDLRPLQDAITKEKEIVTSLQRVSKDWTTAAEAMKQWGAGEGEDLGDITNASLLLSTHIAAAFNTFADHELAIRAQLKDVRTKEEQLDELRRRRKTVAGKLEAQERKLSKMGPENKGLSLANEQLVSLQNELRHLDTSILVDMSRLSDYKRRILRSILTLKYGGLVELSEKLTIIGDLGKLVAAEVPQDLTQPGQSRAPYMSRETVSSLVGEASRCVAEIKFNPNPDTEQTSKPNNVGAMHQATPYPSSSGAPGRHQTQASVASGAGTMPPNREVTGPADEFGRPIEGLPFQSQTMPAIGGSGPIQHLPLSIIQETMRTPQSPPRQGTGLAQYGQPGPGPSSSAFRAPGPPPSLSNQHRQQPSQGPQGSVFLGQPGGATVERGLTLSLPIRSPAPQDASGEKDSPFVPPTAGPPSSFKPPAPTVARQGTTDSDIVLGESSDLQRTSTLPPKVGLGEFPAWSLGLGDFDGSPTKESAGASLAAPPADQKKELPPSPAPGSPSASTTNLTSTDDPKVVPPLSAVPRVLQGGTDSANQTPLTQTPTTYSNAQTPTVGNSEAPVIHHHLVDDPHTRSQSNSGRFAMFPDRRRPTGAGTESSATAADEGLLPPHAKYGSHPGVDRTPSPYPSAELMADVSPVPTPGDEKSIEALPLNVGRTVSSSSTDTPLAEDAPRSILIGGPQSRSASQAVDAGPPKIHFAPRPISPITPSPVTQTHGLWASKDDLANSISPAATSGSHSTAPTGYIEAGEIASQNRSRDNRASVITPLEVHKKLDGTSQPTTPSHGASFTREPTMTDEQFNAMLDSFSAQLGSPNSSSNPPSGVESGADSSFNSAQNPNPQNVTTSTFNQQSGPDSSLETTAAVAGSPFPSPTPSTARPAQSFALTDPRTQQLRGSNSGSNLAGMGSAAYSRTNPSSARSQRRMDTESDDEESTSGKTIAAGAFKRSAHNSPQRIPARQTEGPSPLGSPALGSTRLGNSPYHSPVGSISSASRPLPSADGSHGGRMQMSDAQESPSLYQTPQSTPQFDNGLPPGAAPSRFNPNPSTYQPPTSPYQSQQVYQQDQGPRWSNQVPQAVHEQPARTMSPASERIPSSLLPGRPGSAAPLAPIGHVHSPTAGQPPSTRGGYNSPPWQQQQHSQGPPSQLPYQHGPYPGQQQAQMYNPEPYVMEESDGLSAYDGIDDGPYAGARLMGRGHNAGYGNGRYGQ